MPQAGQLAQLPTRTVSLADISVLLSGHPTVGMRIRTIPRRDLDPRGPNPVPGRNNVQDYLGINDVCIDDVAAPGMWLWDNREHQYWRGNDGSFLPRHTAVTDQSLHYDGPCLRLGLSYLCQDIHTRQEWAFTSDVDESPFIDCALTVANAGEVARHGYSQFFANYHPGADGALYLDRADVLREAPEYSLLEISGAESIAADIDADWIRTPTMERVEGVAPVLLSPPYAGNRWRHLMLFSPGTWGLAAWRSAGSLFDFRALDYLVGPTSGTLAAGATFTAQVRHLFVPSDVTAAEVRRHLDGWLATL